jgi:hypothetical protein
MAKSNPHRSSNFDDLLKEDGIYEAVQARAQTCACRATRRCHARGQAEQSRHGTAHGHQPLTARPRARSGQFIGAAGHLDQSR